MSALLQVNDLKKHFVLRGGLLGLRAARVYAVDGVSFQIDRGETLALVGESGCGKSTVGRAILRLFDITAGQVVLDGQRLGQFPAVDQSFELGEPAGGELDPPEGEVASLGQVAHVAVGDLR